MEKQFYVYIISNEYGNVLYTGVTSNLKARISQHKEKITPGFTSRYNVNRLLYYEMFNDAYNAITREKQIKSGSRKKKVDLITGTNPEWKDLYEML